MSPIPPSWRTRKALCLLSISVMALSTFALLAVGVVSGASWTSLDPAVTAWAVGSRRPPITPVAWAFTHLGGSIGLTVLTLGAAGALLVRRRPFRAGVLLVSMAISSALTVALKEIIGRIRPSSDLLLGAPASTHSFPSGHSFNTLVLTGALAGLVLFSTARVRSKLLAVGATALITVGVGASRVYLGYHWASDVLAGWCIGLAWLGVVGLVVLAIRSPKAEPALSRIPTTNKQEYPGPQS